MASSGKLEVEVEIKSAADKFWENIRNSTNLFPKVFPDQYKSIEVLEGDGKAVGSVRLLTYAEGNADYLICCLKANISIISFTLEMHISALLTHLLLVLCKDMMQLQCTSIK